MRIIDRIGCPTAFAIVLASWPLLFLAACSSNEQLPRSVVQSFEQAFNADDLPRCLALFADDAQILPEHGAIVTGRSDIEQFLKDQMTPVISFNTETDMSLVRGDLAVEQGHYRVRDVRRGSDVEMGKYVHVWRNVRGDWKLYRIIYNTDVEPATEVSVADASDDVQ